MNQKAFIDKSIQYIVILLTFLVPVFFLPITTEFFEFNKIALITLSTLLIVVLWGIKLLTDKKVFSVKSPLNTPVIVFLVVLILATIFSLNPYMSIFGKYGRWFPGLFSYAILIVFYFATAINMNSTKMIERTLTMLTAGATLSSLVAILSYFGIFISGSSYAQSPSFNLAGSVTTTAVVATIAMLVALNQLLNSEKQIYKVIWIQVLVVNSIVVGLYNVLPAWIVLLAGICLTLILNNAQILKRNTSYLVATLGIVSAIVLVTLLPQTRNALQNEAFSKELTLSFTDSWIISSSTVTDFPLLGSGTGTFSLNFSRYRPVRLNATDLWNIRFDKPFNELFNIMGTLGIVGVLAATFLVVKTIKFALYARKYNEDSNNNAVTLSVVVLTLLIVHLFTYATILNTYLLFLSLGLLTATYALNTKRGDGYVEQVQLSLASLSSLAVIGGITDIAETKKRENFQYLAIIPMALFVAFVSYYSYMTYKAEVYLRNSIEAVLSNDGTKTYENQRLAINMNPQRAEYRNTYAQTNLLLASNLSKSENLSEDDKKTVQTLIAQSIRETRLATELINPLAVGNWEVRASVYRSLIGVAENADQWALGAFNTAIQLDPTNPRLRLEAGGVYFLQKDYLSAANLFRQATSLKPDYANAHYNLAQALKQLQNYDLAQKELEVVQRIIPQDSADRQKVSTEIEELKKLNEGKQQANPTVEALDQQAQIAEQGKATTQENLTNPAETIPVTPEVPVNVTE